MEVKVGQVYKDNDPRSYRGDQPRLLTVQSVGKKYAICMVMRTGRETKIRLDRMGNNRSTGYSLIQDVA